MKKIPIILISAFFLVLAAVPGAARAEIKMAILPRLGPVEMFIMFSPLAEYLTRETGEKVSIVMPKDFQAFKAALKRGELELGFANPLIYVQLKNEMPLEPLAVASELKAGTKFRGILIVRKETAMKKVQDLKGKRLVFVDGDSAAGYVFQLLLLHNAGFDMNKDFTILPFAKKHDNVLMAVFNKAADAGGMREDDLEQMKNKVDLSQIRIVGYTDYHPNWPFFATPTLNAEMRVKIKTALLKLNANNAHTLKILSAARLTGFAPAADADYNDLRHAARLVGGL